MKLRTIGPLIGVSIIGLAMLVGVGAGIGGQGSAQAQESSDREGPGKRFAENDRQIKAHAARLLEEGRNIFRFDTYGSEAFFGDALQLHRAIAGAQNGGVGPGVSPKTALAVGLKVDADALPERLKAQLRAGKVNLDDPATTGSTRQARSSPWAPNAPCVIRTWTIPSRRASASGWTAGPTAI